MLPLKRSFVYAIIANVFGGAYIGATNVMAYRTGGLGVFSIFNTIDPNGAITMNFWNIIIGFLISLVIGFALQMFFPVPSLEGEGNEGDVGTENDTTPEDKKNKDNSLASAAELQESAKEEIIASPVSGQAMDLSETPDEVFSSGALGKGLAIDPSEGIVKAPANGTISALFETGHAIGITTTSGTELLVHIGLDTVELEGKGFETLVEKDQEVKAGQELIRFDIDVIKEAGYSPVIPLVVTNTNDFTDVLLTSEEKVEIGDYLLTTLR